MSGRTMAAAALCVALASAAAVSAQDLPLTEGFAGYSYAPVSGQGLHGWTAGLGFNFIHWLALDLEVASQGGSLDGSDVTRLSFLAGARFSKRSGRVTPFVRLAGGLLRTTSGLTVRGVTISAHETDPAGLAGAGVDVALGRYFGLRLGGDYFVTSADGQTQGDPRAAVAIRYRLHR